MRLKSCLLCFGFVGCGLATLMLLGCVFAENKMVAGNIAAINHVEGTAINWFSVNGYRAHGGGGSSCCIIMPVKWRPGLEVDIEWEVDPNSDATTPPLGTDEFKAFMVKHKSNYRRYSVAVDVPEWPERKLCSLNVHFLTCKRVEVTTSCSTYGQPDYPVKEPRHAKEPAVCAK
ncbi:DUF3304 domain-containing protein [Pseudomonas sp. Marseille-Q1929]|uniref:DUF3304 domain-containing protein n=1 Tax=Pseudomonas sp. Marseille-Q1929 TaxID=2730402 RepID=UPI001A8CB277|nr:DUF3304 domain-containing protein [Pseudomonas sp. Marseille-Q1929]MBO0494743.1 DUF3304 domain-containing protein [Pseudomonas sp. Marseille-Q1929]